MKFIKTILKKIYDPEQKVGEFGSSGSKIDNTETNPEPNKYQANQNTAGELHPDGGVNIDRDARTTMKDVQDFHVVATQELLGNPQVIRPVKNNFKSIDQQLKSQYFSNLEQR